MLAADCAQQMSSVKVPTPGSQVNLALRSALLATRLRRAAQTQRLLLQFKKGEASWLFACDLLAVAMLDLGSGTLVSRTRCEAKLTSANSGSGRERF